MTRASMVKPTKARNLLNRMQPHRCGLAHILVVEDDKAAAFSVKRTVESCHCTVDFANSGKAAVQKASKNSYDLILMDLGLPDFSGTKVTKKIRAFNDPVKSNVPIVALTGHAGKERLPDLRKIGMQDLIEKPADEKRLQSILDRFVSSKKSDQITKNENDLNLKQLKVIDWDACLQRETVRGNKNALYQLLSILVDEFKTTKKVLKKAYKKKDNQSLRDELHKCRGGLTYLNLPELENAMKAFHDAIRAKPPKYERLERTYKSAIDAINHFQKTYVKRLK